MLRKVGLFLCLATGAYKTLLVDTACVGRARGRCSCLSRLCVRGVSCSSTVLPIEKHVLKVGVRKMGCTVKRCSLVTSAERVPSEQWDIWQNHFEGEAGDFVGTSRLPQEETEGAVSWADASPLPSPMGGRGKTRSSALSTRMRLLQQKSKIIHPCGLYLPRGS